MAVDIIGLLQIAFADALTSGSPAAVARLYDLGNVPAPPTYPYVVIGEFSATEAGDKDSGGWDFSQNIDVYASGNRGKKDAQELMAAIYARLHGVPFGDLGGSPAVGENDSLLCKYVELGLADDDIGIHGLLRFEGYLTLD